ncbi:MAG: Mut7-C RNAse domain-containing protein [Candidatus Methanomethylicia archaeon]
MADPIFIVDGMLGNLARWLRILGYDTMYCPLSDDIILEKAYSEGRILLTKDKALFRSAVRKGVKSILIDGENIADILLNIALTLNIRVKPQKTSRCPICNGYLNEVGSNNIRNLVPKNILSKNSIFWICRSCGKVYWHGSHWRLITSTLSRVDKMIKNVNKAEI